MDPLPIFNHIGTHGYITNVSCQCRWWLCHKSSKWTKLFAHQLLWLTKQYCCTLPLPWSNLPNVIMLAEAILNLEKLEMICEIYEFFLRVAPRSARLQQIACTSSFLPSIICNLNNNYVMFYGSILVICLW